MIDHVNTVLGDIKSVCPEYDEAVGYELAGMVWFQGWNDYAATNQYPLSDGDQQYASYSDLMSHFIRDVRRDLKTPELPFVIGVIGVNGNHTPGSFRPINSAQLKMERLRAAMAAPAELPEFEGNVIAVPTAPFWDDELGAIGLKQLRVKAKRTQLIKKSPDGPNADGSMTPEEIRAFVKNYKAELFTPEETQLAERAMGTGGFVHYYGSAKFHALAGQAFATALLEQQKAGATDN